MGKHRIVSGLCGGVMVAATLIASAPSMAHHSYAMFDLTKRVEASATVRTWVFGNPHATLWIYINGADGKPKLWSIEAAGTAALVRAGFDRNTVKPGDKITVEFNPLRNGENGGNLVSIQLADGRTLRSGGPPGGN